MEVVERIKQHLAAQPVVLFMKGTPDFPQCGFSAQTVAALRHLDAKFHSVNIFEISSCETSSSALNCHLPQLYVKGELIGGCDIAMQMLQNGELKQLIDEAVASQSAA